MLVVDIVAGRIAPYTGKIAAAAGTVGTAAANMPVVQDTVGTAADIAAVVGTAVDRNRQTYCLLVEHMQRWFRR